MIFTMRRTLASSAIIVLILTIWHLVGSTGKAFTTIYTDWSRDLAEVTPAKYRFLDKPFYAGVTGSIGGLLHVLCRYRLRVGATKVSLSGSDDANGDFWPAASLAVSNSRNGNWVSVNTFNPTRDVDVVTIDQSNPTARLCIGAEHFRPLIGAYRWGRITLINDKQAKAIFALEDLLPPRSRRPEGEDFKEVLADHGKLEFGSVAFLHSVIWIKGRLTGEFVYIGDRRRATLTGIRAPTGDFWPVTTLEVGNSEGEWVKISETKPSGSLNSPKRHTSGDRFRVNLDAYRSNIGKAKFGKVTFSDSSFAVFLIHRIDPSVMDETPTP